MSQCWTYIHQVDNADSALYLQDVVANTLATSAFSGENMSAVYGLFCCPQAAKKNVRLQVYLTGSNRCYYLERVSRKCAISQCKLEYAVYKSVS